MTFSTYNDQESDDQNRCEYSDCKRPISDEKYCCDQECELQHLRWDRDMSIREIQCLYDRDEDGTEIYFWDRIASTLLRRRIDLEDYLRELFDEYEDDNDVSKSATIAPPTQSISEPEPTSLDVPGEFTAQSDVTSSELDQSSPETSSCNPALIRLPATATVEAYIAIAKHAHALRQEAKLSVRRIAANLRREHGVTYDYSLIARLVKVGKLLHDYPELNLSLCKSLDHLIRLTQIPEYHQEEAFTTSTITTRLGTLKVFESTRAEWNAIVKQLKNGTRIQKPKVGTKSTSLIARLCGEVLATTIN